MEIKRVSGVIPAASSAAAPVPTQAVTDAIAKLNVAVPALKEAIAQGDRTKTLTLLKEIRGHLVPGPLTERSIETVNVLMFQYLVARGVTVPNGFEIALSIVPKPS